MDKSAISPPNNEDFLFKCIKVLVVSFKTVSNFDCFTAKDTDKSIRSIKKGKKNNSL